MATHKELAFVGLGRMGKAMAAHLVEDGYQVHGFDTLPETRHAAADVGVIIHESLKETIASLTGPRTIWLMVPSRHVEKILKSLKKLLRPEDTLIDGGNSFFKDSIHRHDDFEQLGIHYIDVGTSGGINGARYGASLMVGGDQQGVRTVEHIFKTLAAPDGYGFVGGPGAGHFVKMIHNGIEYGMMGALAEGVNILHEHQEGLDINIMESLKAYENGSIISSSLTSWLVDAYQTPGYLNTIAGVVPKGETEMEMKYVVNHNKARVLNAALTQRKLTRTEPSRTGSLISAMRNQFGGHKTIEELMEKKTGK